MTTIEKSTNNFSLRQEQPLYALLDSFQTAIDHFLLLLTAKQTRPTVSKQIFVFYKHSLTDLVSTLKRNETAESDKKMSFAFVESEFVKAIKMGYWCLLDNVDNAPPEIIERLNSLLEEKPTLNIYEHHDGDELSLANGKIHTNFRLFATANSQRVSSYKLSAAFLNRIIRIWLPQIDDNLCASQARQHDVYEIANEMIKIAAPHHSTLALMLVKFHAELKDSISRKEISLGQDITLTFRRILKSAHHFVFLLDSKTRYIYYHSLKLKTAIDSECSES